jgi:SAM-dependent methyltransferase
MLHYRDLPIIKTVTASHDYVLAEIGYPIVRHPYNYFIDEVLDVKADPTKSFYRKHWPDDPISDERVKMCQAKACEQDSHAGQEPIDVMINDIGQFVILDGNHRACIQSRFRGGMITMNVRYVSPSWKSLSNYIDSIRDVSGKIYQRVEHPYFADIPYHYDDSRARDVLDSIHASKPANNFIYEIGCNTGMFSRHFASRGYFPFGFDIASDNIMAAEMLARAGRLRGYYFHESDVLTMLKNHNTDNIGAVTCISVIHHYARKGDMVTFKEYIREAARVGTVAYFDSETEYDNRRGYYKTGNFPDEQFMEKTFIELGLKYSKISTGPIGRTIYMVKK